MADVFTTRTTTGYGGKIKNSFGAALVGVALFVGSFFLLGWNEGNAVKVHAALNWAQEGLVKTEPQPLNRSLDGKVVYLTGEAAAPDMLTDPDFAVGNTGLLRLRRMAEMYQWTEEKTTRTKDKLGGGQETVTEYKYAKKWAEQAIDSTRFHMAAQYVNPAMPVQSQTFNAQTAMLGDYHLSAAVLQELGNFDQSLPPSPQQGYSINGQELYKGTNPQTPQIGDVRISFSAVPVGPVSLIGQQTGNEVKAATAPSGRDVLLVSSKTEAPEAMFASAHKQQDMLTWILRGAGFLMMWIGLRTLLQPLRAIASFVPPLAWLFDVGVGIIAFGIALLLSAGTIAVAWFAYRPLLSVMIFGGAAAIALLAWIMRRPKHLTPQAAITGDGQSPIITRG